MPAAELRSERRGILALSGRAGAAAPYLQQLLYDQEVQDALREAVGATRDAYARGREKSARQVVNDKKLRRQFQQALAAAGELWSALAEPAPRHKPRWGGTLAAAAVVAAGAFLALNPDARAKVLALTRKDAKVANPSE
jgi:hypothetical protein